MGIREELFGMAVVASGVCSSKLMLGGAFPTDAIASCAWYYRAQKSTTFYFH